MNARMQEVALLIKGIQEQAKQLQLLNQQHRTTGKQSRRFTMNQRQEEAIDRTERWLTQLAEQVTMCRTALKDFQIEGHVEAERLNNRLRRLSGIYSATEQSLKEIKAVTHLKLNENRFPLSEDYVKQQMPSGDFNRSGLGRTRPEIEPLPRDIQERYERKQQ